MHCCRRGGRAGSEERTPALRGVSDTGKIATFGHRSAATWREALPPKVLKCRTSFNEKMRFSDQYRSILVSHVAISRPQLIRRSATTPRSYFLPHSRGHLWRLRFPQRGRYRDGASPPPPPSPPSPASSLAATTAIKGGRLNPSTAASRAVHRLSPASSRLSSPRPGRPGHPSPQRPSPTPAVERRCFHLGQVAAGGSPSPGGMTLPAGCGRGARGTATPRASRPDAACAPVWGEPRGEGRGHP